MNMLEHDDSPDDSVDVALGVLGQPSADDRLREVLLSQTLGVVRRRRRMRRCAMAAVLAACYLAGIVSVNLWRTEGPVSPPTSMSRPILADKDPIKTDAPRQPLAAAIAPQKHPAESKKPSGFEAWRRIGDHYLRETGDLSLAVAGYSEAINLASEKELELSPGQDNWILMALKDAKLKERNHAYLDEN
jgi:hypothetical protein